MLYIYLLSIVEDVRKIITASPTKSCYLDPWPTFLVKDCLDILITPIKELVNMILSSGVFPDEFKQAIVPLLIKKPSLCILYPDLALYQK